MTTEKQLWCVVDSDDESWIIRHDDLDAEMESLLLTLDADEIDGLRFFKLGTPKKLVVTRQSKLV